MKYSAYGLVLHSQLPFPELPEGGGSADVLLRLGPPERTAAVERSGDEVRLFRDDAGSLRVRGGREIVVGPLPGADPRVVRLNVLGAGLGVLLHQRGRLVLHASAAAVGGGAVAILGARGSGKSTLAASLHRSGRPLVADDVTPVDGEGRAIPGFPQIKLYPDAARALGHDPAPWPRVHPESEKRAFELADGFAGEPLPLRRLFVLAEGDALAIEPIPGREAMIEIARQAFCPALVEGRSHFDQCAALAERAEVLRLRMPRSLDVLGEAAQRITEGR